MKKYIIISLLALSLMGCATSVDKSYYDVGYEITVVIADRDADWLYWYKLVDEKSGKTMGFYTNKRWNIGDTVHIGARWGKDDTQ